jgi:hypothetical protein
MDRYTKTVLTIIALALVTLNLQLLHPAPVQAGLFDGAPTVGDSRRVREIEDKEARSKARSALIARIPMVYVWGGSVSVD